MDWGAGKQVVRGWTERQVGGGVGSWEEEEPGPVRRLSD